MQHRDDGLKKKLENAENLNSTLEIQIAALNATVNKLMSKVLHSHNEYPVRGNQKPPQPSEQPRFSRSASQPSRIYAPEARREETSFRHRERSGSVDNTRPVITTPTAALEAMPPQQSTGHLEETRLAETLENCFPRPRDHSVDELSEKLLASRNMLAEVMNDKHQLQLQVAELKRLLGKYCDPAHCLSV